MTYQENSNNSSLKNHLESRHCFPDKHGYQVHLDEENQVATFLCFNLTGQLTGCQRYRPNAPKAKSNDVYGRYMTRALHSHYPMWGFESFRYTKYPVTLLTEGLFNAARMHNYEFRALATLSDNPKNMRSQLALLPGLKVALCDGDLAGNSLKKYADVALTMPTGHDVNSLPESDMTDLVSELEKLAKKA